MNKEKIYEMIKRDIQERDTMHYFDAGYDNWCDFIADWNFHEDCIEEVIEIVREMGEEHWEDLWTDRLDRLRSC